MLPRLILVFVLFSLMIVAIKKGLSSDSQPIQPVPGYPEPVALKKFVPSSDENFLENLPSAKDYALAIGAEEKAAPEVMGPHPQTVKKELVKRQLRVAKRGVANKAKTLKR